MTRKKLILEIEDADLNFEILGIVSSESHLEFVHILNKSGNFQFHRMEDLYIKENSIDKYFIRFEFLQDELEQRHLLIKNKGNNGILSKEFKSMDYLLIIYSENKSLFKETFNILQKLKIVQAVIIYDKKQLIEKTLRILNQ